MGRAYLLLGSNSQDKLRQIRAAGMLLADRVGSITNISRLYETEPWGFESSETFLNQAIEIVTPLLPKDMLHEALAIEKDLGRTRSDQRFESRNIDIDILFYDDCVLQDEILQIPHPRLHLRRFTLVPLAEIAGEMQHPVLRKGIYKLLEDCTDPLMVKVFNHGAVNIQE